jgi:hypothetical protein
MARTIHKLTDLDVKALIKRGKPGRHSDGGGLYLKIDTGRDCWTSKFTLRGKTLERGLGPAGTGGVSLKQAREKAAECRALVAAGRDPREVWSKTDDKEVVPTFGQAADEHLAAHEGSFRNDKHKAQWRMTLMRYCDPIRPIPVDQIDTEVVLSVLKPLWTRAPETASRLRGRIEVVLDATRARGFIPQNQANPARWRGHLDKLLPKRAKLSRGHHA